MCLAMSQSREKVQNSVVSVINMQSASNNSSADDPFGDCSVGMKVLKTLPATMVTI